MCPIPARLRVTNVAPLSGDKENKSTLLCIRILGLQKFQNERQGLHPLDCT